MLRRYFRKNKLKNASFVEPDEIFLDAKNISNFDQQQFEGRIEKPIPKRNVIAVGIFFTLICSVFFIRLGQLQINKGEAYFQRSENNTLNKVIIFSERGIIYDRDGQELAWNRKSNSMEEEVFSTREYRSPGFSHVLGYVNSPVQDKKGEFWRTEYIGKDGLEKIYGDYLQGQNGSKIIEVDVHNEIQSENVVNTPIRGKDLYTSIDADIQTQVFNAIKSMSEEYSFTGGAGVIMDVETGEILTSTSYPEYDSLIISQGKDAETINQYLKDPRKVFLDRTISGLYTPGSIVKPFFALGALAENIINPYKEILSTGSISIPNPYFKDQETVFNDWKAHGWTDMSEAIAVSSDVYFYAIGGGFEDQKGLGISNLEKYARAFGMGEKTGVDLPDEKSGSIPNPEWKLKTFDGDPWRIGDTYNTSIGQYGFLVTPMEMTRATAALANRGDLLNPHFILGSNVRKKKVSLSKIKEDYYDEIHLGMREAVTYGTAVSLNVPYVEVAAKTGTAQVGISKSKINSWIVGFFPYEKPKYAFTVMMEGGPSGTLVGASSVMRKTFDWMQENKPQYFE